MLDPWLVGDPLWPQGERTPDKLAEVDVILVTHAHFDHAAGIEEICKANKEVTVIAQMEFAFYLMEKGVKNVIPINKGGTFTLDGISYSMVGAEHTFSGDKDQIGTAAGFVIQLEDGFKIYAAGDTGLTADMKYVVSDFFKPDLAILPVIGTFVMEPEQAAFAANLIKPKYVIPFHDFPEKIQEAADPKGYEEFVKQFPIATATKEKTTRFCELMEEYKEIRVISLDIGESTEIE